MNPDIADPHAEELFRAYVEAQDDAKASLNIKDCLIAGRAWSRFIRSFEDRDPVVETVVAPLHDGVTVGRLAEQSAIEIFRDENGFLRIVQFDGDAGGRDDQSIVLIAVENVPRFLSEIARVMHPEAIDSQGQRLSDRGRP